MIYTSARWADEAQTEVFGTDAFGNTERRKLSDPHEFRREDEFITGFLSGGGFIADYDPTSTPPHLNNGGLVRFAGSSPPTVFEAIKMLSVTRVSKGRFRVHHESSMPSDQYSANPFVLDANPRLARVTARTPVYVEVRVTDLAGVAQDPTEITVQTQRVVY
jgi:hypothetical protein